MSKGNTRCQIVKFTAPRKCFRKINFDTISIVPCKIFNYLLTPHLKPADDLLKSAESFTETRWAINYLETTS